MLKEAQYPCWAGGPEFPRFNKVVYTVIGNCCYFSGIELEKRTSTINAAESIVLVIAHQEGVPATSLRYFDLQTHRGYEKPSGEYEIDELNVQKYEPPEDLPPGAKVIGSPGKKGGISIRGWIRTECPPEVCEMFKEYIGESAVPVKIWNPDEARQAGYEPEEMRSPNVGACLHYLRLHQGSADIFRQLAGKSLSLAVFAEQLVGSSHRDALIIVDCIEHPVLLAANAGQRYWVWKRTTLLDN